MRITLLALLALLLGSGPEPGATLKGTVTFTSDGKVVAYENGFVYLQERRPKAYRGATVTTSIVQRGVKFVPQAIVVPAGSTVAFPNLDDQDHNVFSPTDPIFDLGVYGTNKTGKSHVFEDPDEFDIFCDIHRCMSATVKVVASPPQWIAKVTGGAFQLSGIPDGEYKLIAWAPHTHEVTVRVTIAAGQVSATPSLDQIRIPLGRSQPHNRKDGTAYRIYNDCPR